MLPSGGDVVSSPAIMPLGWLTWIQASTVLACKGMGPTLPSNAACEGLDQLFCFCILQDGSLLRCPGEVQDLLFEVRHLVRAGIALLSS